MKEHFWDTHVKRMKANGVGTIGQSGRTRKNKESLNKGGERTASTLKDSKFKITNSHYFQCVQIPLVH